MAHAATLPSVPPRDRLIPRAYTRFQQTRHFGSLDGLRAISIVAVIWHHTCGAYYVRHWWLAPLGIGYLGVHLFFIISGFLITTLLLRERAEHGNISLRLFYARRTLRIFPLYYAVLLVYTLLVLAVEGNSAAGQAFFHNLPSFATYTANLFMVGPADDPHRVIFAFAWSLAAEEQFYLWWPYTLKKLRMPWIWLLLLGAIALDQFLTLACGNAVLGAQTHRVLTAIATPIIFGVIVALLLNSPRGYAWLYRLCGWRGAGVAMLAVPLVVLELPWASQPQCAEMVALSFVPLLIACVIREDHALREVLQWRLAASVGVVSYGMYLLHMFAVHGTDLILSRLHMSEPIARFALALPGTFGLALLSYHLFERRFLRLKERFTRRNALATASGPAVPALVP